MTEPTGYLAMPCRCGHLAYVHRVEGRTTRYFGECDTRCGCVLFAESGNVEIERAAKDALRTGNAADGPVHPHTG